MEDFEGYVVRELTAIRNEISQVKQVLAQHKMLVALIGALSGVLAAGMIRWLF